MSAYTAQLEQQVHFKEHVVAAPHTLASACANDLSGYLPQMALGGTYADVSPLSDECRLGVDIDASVCTLEDKDAAGADKREEEGEDGEEVKDAEDMEEGEAEEDENAEEAEEAEEEVDEDEEEGDADHLEPGARVLAWYEGAWYVGEVICVPDEDEDGRWTVQCDVDEPGFHTYTHDVMLLLAAGADVPEDLSDDNKMENGHGVSGSLSRELSALQERRDLQTDCEAEVVQDQRCVCIWPPTDDQILPVTNMPILQNAQRVLEIVERLRLQNACAKNTFDFCEIVVAHSLGMCERSGNDIINRDEGSTPTTTRSLSCPSESQLDTDEDGMDSQSLLHGESQAHPPLTFVLSFENLPCPASELRFLDSAAELVGAPETDGAASELEYLHELSRSTSERLLDEPTVDAGRVSPALVPRDLLHTEDRFCELTKRQGSDTGVSEGEDELPSCLWSTGRTPSLLLAGVPWDGASDLFAELPPDDSSDLLAELRALSLGLAEDAGPPARQHRVAQRPERRSKRCRDAMARRDASAQQGGSRLLRAMLNAARSEV